MAGRGGRAEALLHEALVQDLSSLLADEDSCDLKLVVGEGGESVGAHKLLMLCRCERLKAYRKQWLSGEGGGVDGEGGGVDEVRLENFNVKTVRSVLRYVYTGKIDLRDQDLFEVLSLASEWGLPLLKAYCIEQLGSTLTVDTASATLIVAHSLLEDYRGGRGRADTTLQEIVGKCLAFIEANARGVLLSDGFLRLSKDTVISIISSSKLAVPEEDVWRAVLRWGRHCSGIETDFVLWTEEDREKMKESLSGLIECVRVMEINSDVFAKEVEPTGLLPMEQTLARYRKAAVRGKGGNGEVTRPRSGGIEPFADTELLAGRADLQMLINEWCDLPTQEWVLLYRASRDGFNARQFHSSCDEKGSTVVIVRNPAGCLFGGFTDVPWSSRYRRGKFASSQLAFLFSLVNPNDVPSCKLSIKQPAYAINNHPSNGPIFGSGADLFISSDCNRNKDSYSQLPVSFGDSSISPHLFTGEQYFLVEDYEVFGQTT